MVGTTALIGAGLGLAGGLLNKKKGSTASSQGTATRTFDPAALSAYQGLQGPAAGVLQDYMKDPWAAGFFQNQMTRASEGTGQRAQTLLGNILNPAMLSQGALSNPNAYLASQTGAIGRGASRERADSFTNLLMGAEQLRRVAAAGAMGYQPLQTGGTSSETTQGPKGSMWGDLLGLGGNILGGIPFGGSMNPPAYTGLGSSSFGNFLNNMPANRNYGPF